MSQRHFLGEFEQMVLLAVLQLKDRAFGPEIAAEIEARARRQVSRGALYATLDRLEQKGMLRWEIDRATSDSGGNRLRRFEVTPAGVEEAARARDAWVRLLEGLDDVLSAAGGPSGRTATPGAANPASRAESEPA